jgi:hypothetical protein
MMERREMKMVATEEDEMKSEKREERGVIYVKYVEGEGVQCVSVSE